MSAETEATDHHAARLAASSDRADRLDAIAVLGGVHEPWIAPVLERLTRDSDPDVGEAARLVVQTLPVELRSAVRRAWFGTASSDAAYRTESAASVEDGNAREEPGGSRGTSEPSQVRQSPSDSKTSVIRAATLRALARGDFVRGRFLVPRVRGELSSTSIDARISDVKAQVEALIDQGTLRVLPATHRLPFSEWEIALAAPSGTPTEAVSKPVAEGAAEPRLAPSTLPKPAEGERAVRGQRIPPGFGSVASYVESLVLAVIARSFASYGRFLAQQVTSAATEAEVVVTEAEVKAAVQRLAVYRRIVVTGDTGAPFGEWLLQRPAGRDPVETDRSGDHAADPPHEHDPDLPAPTEVEDASAEATATAAGTARAGQIEEAIVEALDHTHRLLGKFLASRVQQALRSLVPAVSTGDVQRAVENAERARRLRTYRGGGAAFVDWIVTSLNAAPPSPAPQMPNPPPVADLQKSPSQAEIRAGVFRELGERPHSLELMTLAERTGRSLRSHGWDASPVTITQVLADMLQRGELEYFGAGSSPASQARVQRARSAEEAPTRTPGSEPERGSIRSQEQGQVPPSRGRTDPPPAPTRLRERALDDALVMEIVRTQGPLVGRHLVSELRKRQRKGDPRLERSNVERVVERLLASGALRAEGPDRSVDFGQWTLYVAGAAAVRVRPLGTRTIRQVPSTEVRQLLHQLRLTRDASGEISRETALRAICSWYVCGDQEAETVDELLDTEWVHTVT